jgi:hypothetical protein
LRALYPVGYKGPIESRPLITPLRGKPRSCLPMLYLRTLDCATAAVFPCWFRVMPLGPPSSWPR